MKIRKLLSVDEKTQLQKEVRVSDINISLKNSKIIVVLEVVLLAPNGEVANKLKEFSYSRENKEAQYTLSETPELINDKDYAFDKLADSAIGQGIIALLNSDLSKVVSEDSIGEDLKQS